MTVFACLGIGANYHCMAPGTCVAQFKVTHVDNGVVQDYLVPVTLRVAQ